MPIDISALVCPRDRSDLQLEDNSLVCAQGHRYPIYDGIPVLLVNELPGNTAIDESLRMGETGERDQFHYEGDGIHPQVSQMVAATNGILYTGVAGRLTRYPIPELRLENAGGGDLFLDVGCNWGRWTLAAAKKGYRATGLDPHLSSLLAARVVAKQLGLVADFVCGDARAMPFRSGYFDTVFSYSVVQHFSRDDAREIIKEISRVLRKEGISFVQMPNALGIRSFYHLARRGFSDGKEFDVRYWTPSSIKSVYSELIGQSELTVDGFFGLGIQPTDLDLMPARYRLVIRSSETLRAVASIVPPLTYLADSIYVKSIKAR